VTWDPCRVSATSAASGASRMSRRALLLSGAAATALLAAGCSSETPALDSVTVDPTAAPEPEPNMIDELTLIGAYLGAISAFPELRGTLTAIADQHRAHAVELGASQEQLDAVEAIAPSAARIRPAATELIKRERAAAQMRAQSAESDSDGDFVRALTFIAASEASHIPELQDVRAALKDSE